MTLIQHCQRIRIRVTNKLDKPGIILIGLAGTGRSAHRMHCHFRSRS